MLRTPAVALSILLAPTMALTMTMSAFCAPSSNDQCCAQPGRLETAREIKTEADHFVLKGRELSQRLNAQISEAQKLKTEAIRLQAQAHLLFDGQTLVAQASSSASADTKAAETKPADNQPSTEIKTIDETKPADGTKPADAIKSDADKKAKDEPLSGRASQLQTLPTPNIPLIKLKGPQLQQAMQQFNVDVAQFRVHAAEYQKHLNLFRSQIGECQAAKGAFDALHKKYEMHCDAYHLNNIPPPHLCLEMNVSASEASSIANQLMSDQMRALRAEAQLNAEEAKLNQLEGMQGKADNLVVKASDRARREREIAGMFGRLRQEYDLLEIERKTIEHSRSANAKPGAVVRPYVSGKIKKGK